jgi:hypothetical protein
LFAASIGTPGSAGRPDATLLSGGPITVSEYKLPGVISCLYRFGDETLGAGLPACQPGSSSRALLVLLHGNHAPVADWLDPETF